MQIQEVGMFHTPESWDEPHEWIERHTGHEKAHVMTAAVMAWNLAAKITKETDKE